MEFQSAVLLAAGSSSSTPFLSCAVAGSDCPACCAALADPRGRNHRLNPSLLLRLRHPADGSLHAVLVDCGKTFRESALKVFPGLEVRDLSAVLLTHDHADACMGLDDLREFRRLDDVKPAGRRGTPVIADERTLQSMRRVFSYLFPAEGEEDGERAAHHQGSKPVRRAWVATIAWQQLQPHARTSVAITSRDRSGAVAALDFVALPVLHGPNYYCNSFLFRMDSPAPAPAPAPATAAAAAAAAAAASAPAPRWFLYMSDVSELDLATFGPQLGRAQRQLLSPAAAADCAAGEGDYQPLELLVLDMMSWMPYVSHLSVEASIALAEQLGARQTYFTGLSHTLEYEEMTRELQRRGVEGRMAMGYDGCLMAEADVRARRDGD